MNRSHYLAAVALAFGLWGVAATLTPVVAAPPSRGQSTVRARLHAAAAPGANTDIATDFTPKSDAVLEVTVCLTESSVFNLISSDGTTEYADGYNENTALSAGVTYTFESDVISHDQDGNAMTYNFQVETDSGSNVIRKLICREVPR